jgi:hypothetical protein
MEDSMEAPQEPKSRTALLSSNSTPKDILKKCKSDYKKAPAHPCLLQNYSQ